MRVFPKILGPPKHPHMVGLPVKERKLPMFRNTHEGGRKPLAAKISSALTSHRWEFGQEIPGYCSSFSCVPAFRLSNPKHVPSVFGCHVFVL